MRSKLLYGIEAWILYAHKELWLSTFHLRCLRRLLSLTWQDHVTHIDILAKARRASIHSMLTRRRLRWLGHVSRMKDSCIPKNLLFGELVSGSRTNKRPSLLFKDFASVTLRQAASTSQGSGQPAQTDRNYTPRSAKPPTQLKKGEMPAGRRKEPGKNIFRQPQPRQPSDTRLVADPASDSTATQVATARVANLTTSMAQVYHDLPRSTAPTK